MVVDCLLILTDGSESQRDWDVAGSQHDRRVGRGQRVLRQSAGVAVRSKWDHYAAGSAAGPRQA